MSGVRAMCMAGGIETASYGRRAAVSGKRRVPARDHMFVKTAGPGAFAVFGRSCF